jgi:hypothetical protein
MFNHSERGQNVGWVRDEAAQTVVYTTLRDIEAGEELCISYGRIWFEDSDGRGDGSDGDGVEILGRIEVNDG